MTKMLIVLFVGLYFEAVGVVLLSKGLKQIPGPQSYMLPEIVKLVARGATNKYIVTGIFFEALFFVALLYLMSKADVSFVWPLTSLSFVFTAVAAQFYLHEHVSALRWGGVILIVCGAALITYSEKFKESQPPVAVSSGEDPGLQNLP